MNVQVASVVEAATRGVHPERLDVYAPPTAWDPAAFAADPRAYLDVIEPGRVWQTAAPGAGVPALEVDGPAAFAVAPNGSVVLAAKTVPRMPMTFTSLDLGSFDNRLTSISVCADEHGIAHATFIATPGTTDDVNILAASPCSSGQAHFIVSIRGR